MLTLTVFAGDETHTISVENGANLRQVLLAHDFSPYTAITNRLNCAGRGLCATCGVWIDEHIEPNHWHDKAADTFGYPRLSCQITIDKDMTVRLLTDKMIWGRRDSDKGRIFSSKQS